MAKKSGRPKSIVGGVGLYVSSELAKKIKRLATMSDRTIGKWVDDELAPIVEQKYAEFFKKK